MTSQLPVAAPSPGARPTAAPSSSLPTSRPPADRGSSGGGGYSIVPLQPLQVSAVVGGAPLAGYSLTVYDALANSAFRVVTQANTSSPALVASAVPTTNGSGDTTLYFCGLQSLQVLRVVASDGAGHTVQATVTFNGQTAAQLYHLEASPGLTLDVASTIRSVLMAGILAASANLAPAARLGVLEAASLQLAAIEAQLVAAVAARTALALQVMQVPGSNPEAPNFAAIDALLRTADLGTAVGTLVTSSVAAIATAAQTPGNLLSTTVTATSVSFPGTDAIVQLGADGTVSNTSAPYNPAANAGDPITPVTLVLQALLGGRQ